MSDTKLRSRRLVIAGGSGFLGRGLIRHLVGKFDEIVVLTRRESCRGGSVQFVHWDARTVGDWANYLDGSAAVVNLVGRTVDCQKTPANKQEILQSRVDSVTALAAAIKNCTTPPPVWVQAATAHIYGDTDDQILDEASPVGTGFAPQVGLAWEQALASQAPLGIRRVVLRISFVLGRDGGPLRILARLAKFGLGGTVGNGRQYMSWIHEQDLYRLIEMSISNADINGVFVASAPNPVTNKDFMQQLRRAVHRPWSPPAPSILVRMGSWLLRTDPELALLGRRVVPSRLLQQGFKFDFPQLDQALSNLI